MDKEVVEKRLLAKRLVDPETECWIWTGARRSKERPYGKLSIDNKTVNVHRIAAWLWKGLHLKSSLFVCHRCDNTLCFNPEHLFLGTQKDNIEDMDKKGRGNRWKKLTEQNVLEVDALLAKGVRYEKIASLFGISSGHVRAIESRRWWKHVPKGGVL